MDTTRVNNMYLLVLHRVPVYPATQVHVYLLIPSTHVAPFTQPLLAHSLISVIIQCHSINNLLNALKCKHVFLLVKFTYANKTDFNSSYSLTCYEIQSNFKALKFNI